MTWGKLRTSWYSAKLRGLLNLFLGSALLAAVACATPPKPEPPIKTPSKIITMDGYEFFVFGLKLPGSSQELKLKEGDTTTWVPLAIMRVVTFTGPEDERFRPAEIVLISGEKLKGDLFVGQLIEGTTDEGYWNIFLNKVRQIGMGAE